MRTLRKISLAAGLAIGTLALPASANHTWGNYHWARTANPFTLQLGDNVTSAWDSYLVTTSADWSVSTVLDTVIVKGSTKARRCGAKSGRVEVCNASYGNTQWLGIASISISGDHILAGTVKLNDTYFNTSTYNSPAWRNLVSCQEVGHTFGLGHQDENFSNPNLNTCMDYTNNPTSNQHPNQHDYDLLVDIYSHLDSTTTVGSATTSSRLRGGAVDAFEVGDTPKSWGRPVKFRRDGRPDVYMKAERGMMILTHVFWLPGKGPADIHDDGTHTD